MAAGKGCFHNWTQCLCISGPSWESEHHLVPLSLLDQIQHGGKVPASAAVTSGRLQAWDMPGPQPGSHIVPHRPEEWQRRVNEGPGPRRIRQIGPTMD